MTNGVEEATIGNAITNFNAESFMTQIRAVLINYGIDILFAIAIIVIGRFIVKGICNFTKRSLGKSGKMDTMLISFMTNILNALLMTFVIIGALSKIGVQTTSLVAALGAGVLAIGLALQGSLSNFASGVLIIMLKPFKVGDFIEAAGTSGIVEDVNIFTTELKTIDNKRIILPNTPIMSSSITNFSHHPTRRVEVIASVSYDDDIDKVKGILKEVINKTELVLSEPEPAVVLKTLNNSSVDFSVRVWVNTPDFWTVLFDMQENIKKTFDANDITIPFPQSDVHLYKTE